VTDIFNFIPVMVSLVLAIGVTHLAHGIASPFMLVMATFSVIVTFDGWIVGAEPFWTDFRPIQPWVVGLYVAGASK
jgi:hypothetical protein